MGSKNGSFHMSNEFNGYGQKTYLAAAQYNSYPALSQENIRLTPDFGSALTKALGGQAVMINASSGNPMLLKILGGLSSANQIVIGKDQSTGQYLFSYAVSGSNEFTNNSYLLAASKASAAPTIRIIPYGWVKFGTTGWKWGETIGNAFKKEGWLKDNGKWYYFSDYWMQTGWQYIVYAGDTRWYYFFSEKDSSGVEKYGHMVTGWMELEYKGKKDWYYFHGNGTMAVSEWISYKGKWYFQRSDGAMQKSSLREWKGKLYYLKDDGSMAVSETITDGTSGKDYDADIDGVCIEKVSANISSGYYMGTVEREQIKYIFGVDPGLQSWSSFSTTLVNEKGKNVVTIEIPVWKFDSSNNNKVSSIKKLTVHKNVEEVVIAIFEEIYNSPEKFPIDLNTTGALSIRNNTTSLHNYAIAIDINWDANAMYNANGTIKAGKHYKPGTDPLSIPSNGSVVAAFKKYGWYWGGDWKSTPDYMHFAYMNH